MENIKREAFEMRKTSSEMKNLSADVLGLMRLYSHELSKMHWEENMEFTKEDYEFYMDMLAVWKGRMNRTKKSRDKIIFHKNPNITMTIS